MGVVASGARRNDELADRGSRLFASIIDSVISLSVVLPTQFALGMFDGFPNVTKQETFAQSVIWGAFAFALWGAFHAYFIARSGQTIGKRVMGIRVVTVSDDRPIGLYRYAFLRELPIYAVTWIPMVGVALSLIDVLFIFRADRRCVHDMIAGTRVIRAHDKGAPATA